METKKKLNEIRVRVSDEEKNTLLELSKQTGFSSLSNYIRHTSLLDPTSQEIQLKLDKIMELLKDE